MFSRIGQQQQQLLAPLASREETETPSMGSANYAVNGSDPTARNSYEDTESEYAVQLRRQTHRHMMGADGGYDHHYGTVGANSRPPTVISGSYATMGANYGHLRAMQVPQDLDLATTR